MNPVNPDDDRAWQAAGFDDTARAGFRQWNIDLEAAIQWSSFGVTDPVDAVRWKIIGVTAQQSTKWRSVGIDSVQALNWHRAGHDLDSAAKAKAQGKAPSTATAGPGSSTNTSMRGGMAVAGQGGLINHIRAMAQGPVGPAFAAWVEESTAANSLAIRYAQQQWVTDDALPWAKAGIQPDQAQLWALLGMRPAEALQMQKNGQQPLAVVAEWWGAGIPLDQVAAWVGAGFTAAEARQQIDAGVDVERAAVLRALRDATDE